MLFILRIEGYNVNLRKGSDTSYFKIRQLNKPEAYVVWAEKDGWLNLGGEQWIKNNPSYVMFNKKSTVDSSMEKISAFHVGREILNV